MSLADPIKHVVVWMQLLGCMQSVYPKLEGVDEKNLRSNSDYPDAANRIVQSSTEMTAIEFDPHHEHVNVMRRICGDCGGFISHFVQSYSQCGDTRRQIMTYYKLGALPVMHTLAQNFMICEHWFSSLPGPTRPRISAKGNGQAGRLGDQQ